MRVWCSAAGSGPLRLHERLREALGHRVAGVLVGAPNDAERALLGLLVEVRDPGLEATLRLVETVPAVLRGVGVDPSTRPLPAFVTAARTAIATAPSSAMRRHASHWAFRPTSRSSQKLCSRSLTMASASSNRCAAMRSPQCARSARSSKRNVSMDPRASAGSFAVRSPSSSSTRSASAAYASANECEAVARARAPPLPPPSSWASGRRRDTSARGTGGQRGTRPRARSAA